MEEKELLKLFDYFRTDGKEEHNAEDCLTIINAALNVDELEKHFTQIIQKLRNIREDIKQYIE